MRQIIVGFIVIVLGGGLVRAGATGDHSAWVTASPITVMGVGVCLIIMGISVTWGAGTSMVSCSCDEPNPAQRWTPWALGLITCVVAGLTPAALVPQSIDKANRAAAVTMGAPSSWPDLDPGTPELGMRELIARSATPADNRLSGRKVLVKGQTVIKDNHTMLTRVSVTCCAADARAYEIELKDPRGKLDGFEVGSWVVVEAVLMPGTGTRERNWTPQVGVVAASPAEDAGYDVTSVLPA